MARAISDEELQLKRRARRRLIGAVVLVSAVVVVLPMVLDSEPGPVSQDITVRIPSPDSGTFTTQVKPLPAPRVPESKSARPQAEEKTAAAPEVPREKPKPAAKPQSAKPDKAPAKPAAKTARPAAKAKGGQLVVQVIALADAEKAQRMQQQISAAGIQSYTEIVKTVKGDVTRVRAGPFPTREAAEMARDQLKALGMNGNITTR
ncbi:MAG: SPOR domain-containing protein [Burkholderiales bacterium]